MPMNLKMRIKIRVKSELLFNIEMSLFLSFERPYKIAVKVGKPIFSGQISIFPKHFQLVLELPNSWFAFLEIYLL